MKRLTLIDKITGLEYEFPIWLRKVKVGRSTQENNLVIPDSNYRRGLEKPEREKLDQKAVGISRKSHFSIYQEKGKVRIGILSGANKVYINGMPAVENIKFDVENGTELILGDGYKLEIRILEE